MLSKLLNYTLQRENRRRPLDIRMVSVWNALQKADDFALFEAKNPQLFDKTMISQFYSAEVLRSQKARSEWVAPDLKPEGREDCRTVKH